MNKLMHLSADEQRAVREAQGTLRKEILIWAERLSASRAETSRVQKAFDRYEEEKEREINRLQRQLDTVLAEKSQNDLLVDLSRLSENQFAPGE